MQGLGNLDEEMGVFFPFLNLMRPKKCMLVCIGFCLNPCYVVQKYDLFYVIHHATDWISAKC